MVIGFQAYNSVWVNLHFHAQRHTVLYLNVNLNVWIYMYRVHEMPVHLRTRKR